MMFEPDDDRDDESGWNSYREYLNDRGDAIDYHPSVPRDVDTDRVDVDPALFGEFPDGEIEVVPDECTHGVVDAETEHEWRREVTLVSMTGACPNCDGPVTKSEKTTPGGDRYIEWLCDDCDSGWVRNPSESFDARTG